MSTDQWDAHIESLLDEITHQPTKPVTPQQTIVPQEGMTSRSRQVVKFVNHPQYITTRRCKNERGQCTGNDSDFIVDANGGSVVCILCGMIQDTSVLHDAPTFAPDPSEHTSSLCVVHRYSRIAYLRGLLTSTDGETKVELTQQESRFIKHYITHHSVGLGGDYKSLVCQIKRSIRRMKLRQCLTYHAHTIAFRLFGKHRNAQNETEIRQVLRRFRALEVEWDRAPKNGPLRQGTKKFPSLPWIWMRICKDLHLSDDTTELFYLPPNTPKRCIEKRERQYTTLTRLALQ